MVEQLVTIRNAHGLHARLASVLSQAANQFSSNIYIQKGLMKVNAKSIMGIMMLAANHGAQLTIRAEGADEEEAIEALSKLVDSGFEETG
jgi:phosphotransferase system HPr (HPr) family protein